MSIDHVVTLTNFVLVWVLCQRCIAMWRRTYEWASKHRGWNSTSNSKDPT